MTVGLETIALGVATIWLTVLTLTLLATIRQVSILTVRLDRDGDPAGPVDDGIEVGSPAPAAITEFLRPVPDRPSFVLVMATVCRPCHELAPQLADIPTSAPVVAVISGRDSGLAETLESRLPPSVEAVRGDAAERAVSELRIATTPFVFEIRDGRIAAKAAIRGIDHLREYLGEAESVPTQKLWQDAKEMQHAR